MPPIRPELLDELLRDYKKPDDLLGQDGLLQQLTKALVERALDGELTHHLGYERHDSAGDNSGNSRNGTTPKTLRGKRGQVQIDVPRDRASEFEPQLVRKGQTRFDGLDKKIISLYARGMTQREIQGHLEEIYGVEISPSLMGASVQPSDRIEVRRMIWAESTDENSSNKPRPTARLWGGAQWGHAPLPFAGANGAISTRRVSLRVTRTPAA